MKSGFEKIGTSMKTFLAGIFAGLVLYALSYFVLPSIGGFVGELASEKSSLIPREPFLMALGIFANNAYVVFVAAILPVGLALIDGKWRLNKGSLLPDRLQSTLKGARDRAKKFAPLVYYILPLAIMLENGAIPGFFLSESAAKAGPHGVWTFIKLVAPHGMVEIPDVMGAGGLGLTLVSRPVKLLRNGEAEKAVEASEENLKSRETGKALFLVLVLLAIGAAIEAFITPTLA